MYNRNWWPIHGSQCCTKILYPAGCHRGFQVTSFGWWLLLEFFIHKNWGNCFNQKLYFLLHGEKAVLLSPLLSSNKIFSFYFFTKDGNILTGWSNHYLQTVIALLLCFVSRVSAELPLKHVSKQCKKWIKLFASIPQKNLETIKYLIETILTCLLFNYFYFIGAVLMNTSFFSASQT